MLQKFTQRRKGFTLVEIMIVVAIIALLAAIALPGFMRARKRTQATRILEDLRIIDNAIDQYAIETNKKAGDSVAWTDIKTYIKVNTVLYSTGTNVIGGDYTGTNYIVDDTLFTPTGTSSALSDVVPVEFWSPFALR
jgi:prepilin-type N-terminal cleavage/methylation domain-containing protein